MERNPVFTTVGEGLNELFALYRHVLCPHYDTCLDEAVIKNQHFDCSKCHFKKNNVVSYFFKEGMPA